MPELNAVDAEIPRLNQRPARNRVSNISSALSAVSRHDDPQDDLSEIDVRPVRNDAELDAVYRLTHDAYVERGYCAPQPDGRLIHYPHLDRIPETTILVACSEGDVVGTISWTRDSATGLHVDADFKAECDTIRKEGRGLASSWRIATKNSCRAERRYVMALIQAAVNLWFESRLATCVFTFNPRHERIYQRMLNMTTVARSAGTHGLNAAPAVLMRAEFQNIPERFTRALTSAKA